VEEERVARHHWFLCGTILTVVWGERAIFCSGHCSRSPTFGLNTPLHRRWDCLLHWTVSPSHLLPHASPLLPPEDQHTHLPFPFSTQQPHQQHRTTSPLTMAGLLPPHLPTTISHTARAPAQAPCCGSSSSAFLTSSHPMSPPSICLNTFMPSCLPGGRCTLYAGPFGHTSPGYTDVGGDLTFMPSASLQPTRHAAILSSRLQCPYAHHPHYTPKHCLRVTFWAGMALLCWGWGGRNTR